MSQYLAPASTGAKASTFAPDNARLITLDLLRGFAIFMMVVLHVVEHNFDISRYYNPDVGVDFSQIPIPLLLLIGILLYLSTWDGLFVLISLTVNVISIQKRLDKGVPLKTAVITRIKWGLVIFGLGYLHNVFFGYDSVIGKSIVSRNLNTEPFFYHILNFIALQIIGLSLILCSILIYFLYRNDGQHKLKRNLIVLGALAMVVVVLTPVVRYLIHLVYPTWPAHAHWSLDAPWQLPVKLFFAILTGNPQPIFPYFITALLGTMFGILLTQGKVTPSLPKYGIYLSLALIGCVGVGLLLGFKVEVDFLAPTIMWLFIELAGQILTISIFMQMIEFGNKREFFTRKTTFLRRWGMIALTVYFFQIIELVPRIILDYVFGWKVLPNGSAGILGTLFILALVILEWEIIFYFWAKRSFKWSMEYILIRWLSGGRIKAPARLKTKNILTEVAPVNFVEGTEKASNDSGS